MTQTPIQPPQQPPADAITPALFEGPQGEARAHTVRVALDQALDAWWQSAVLPPPLLLRDGLLMLEAGHTLDEPQRSLLLRAALAEHRGMFTALAHQTDPERTAVILADALLTDGPAPLTIPELTLLRQEDARSNDWMEALHSVVLEETSSPDEGRRERAQLLLRMLQRDDWNVASAAAAIERTDAADYAAAEPTPWLRTTWLRAVLLLALLLAMIVGVLWWQQRARFAGMVSIPAGAYPVSQEASGGQGQVALPAFVIDRTEVTNDTYRRCVAAKACAQPVSPAGATRPQYWLYPAFNQYPVVNLSWADADRFCAYAGKRLPTAAEWEVAAGYAPDTRRSYTFPWGDQFQVQRANSAATGIGDTQVVGSYRPLGDSPWGASDMAGNVAEWTASNVGKAAEGKPDRFLVKGGSFEDKPDALRVAASVPMESILAAPWLGFRCAATVPGNAPVPTLVPPGK